ncbi:MAG TPA: hypothetical protein VFT39_06555 [Vicinamibacterales bacterium]|nr:hypothetical protein [Vicinamibacterales bacterium]
MVPLLALAEIKRSDVRDVVEQIKKRAPIHANRTFAYIRHAFNFALDREWIDSNPCAGIHKRIRTEERERRRVLAEDELRSGIIMPQHVALVARLNPIITMKIF